VSARDDNRPWGEGAAAMSLVPIYRGPFEERRRIMPLINVLIVLVIVGVVLWLVNTYIPMDAKIKKILNIVVVIGVVIWLLRAFGILGSLSQYRIGR
jgi:hypothetical protein